MYRISSFIAAVLKRTAAVIPALCIMAQMLILPVNAESGDTVIKINNRPYYNESVRHGGVTFSPEIEYVSGTVPHSYKYQWYVLKDTVGVWRKEPWETSSEFTIGNYDGASAIRVDVTPVDENGNPTGATVNQGSSYFVHSWMLGLSDFPHNANPEKVNENTVSLYQETPEEYLFEVDGVKLILLDVRDEANDTFCVMMEDGVEKIPFDTNGTVIFEPESESNIGYWLNNDFLNGSYLPESVKSYINNNHSWRYEKPKNGAAYDSKGTAYWNEYSKTAPIGLMGYSDYMKYFGRFGHKLSCYQNDETPAEYRNSDAGWWLGTVKSYQGGDKMMASMQTGFSTSAQGRMELTSPTSTDVYARPMFYLNESFFKNVKPDKMGAKVKGEILRRYSADELKSGAGYTDYELQQLGFDTSSVTEIKVTLPTASQDINHCGYKLTPTITHVSGKEAAYYKYQWYKYTNSQYIPLTNETNETFIIGNENNVMNLCVGVTPMSENGYAMGMEKKSNTYFIYPLGRVRITDLGDVVKDYQNTPKEHIFEVDGKKYILVDYSTNSENDAFYVMCENGVAQRPFDEDNLVIFDVTNPKNVGYWLNNDFLNGDYLSPSITAHINREHKWWTERPKDYSVDVSGKERWADFSQNASVALMGYSDYIKYFGRFGLRLPEYKYYGDDGFDGYTSWWLRSARGYNDILGSVCISSHHGKDGKISGTVNSAVATNAKAYVRPVFYLKRDFFKNVKLDARTTGDFVKQAIRDVYDLSEIKSGTAAYSNRELTALGYETDEYISEFNVTTTPGTDCYEFFNHSDAYYDVAVENKNFNSRKTQLHYIVTPLMSGGESADVTKEITIPFGTTTERIDLRDFPNGKYTVEISLKESGFEFYNESFTMNLLNNVSGADYRFADIGVNNSLSEKDCQILIKSGITHVRTVLTWDGIEKTAGEYDFSSTDTQVENARKYGIKFTALLAYGNPIYTGEGTSDKAGFDTPEEKEAWLEYVRRVVSRYPDLYALEIWNEPNATGFWEASWEDYIDTCKLTIEEIRKINKTIPIYIGSIDISRQGLAFMQEMIDAKLHQMADGISYHPYFHPYTVENCFNPLRQDKYTKLLMDNGGWKTLPITEVGYETKGDPTLFEKQARETVKSLVASQHYHNDEVMVYCFRDNQRNTISFGAMDKNYDSVEMLFALNQYMAELNDAVYLTPVSVGTNTTAHLFLKGREPVLVAWSNNSTEKQLEFNVPITANDYFGNAVTVTDNTVSVGQNPVYIKGMDNDYIYSAVMAELKKLYGDFSAKYTVEIPDYASSISDKESIKNLILTHYKNGLALRNTLTDDNAFFGALYHWNYIGELLVRYYSLFADDEYIGTYDRAVRYISNTHNQYAQAIARYALNMADKAKKFSESNMSIDVRSGYAAAYDLYSGILMSYANYFDGDKTDADILTDENGIDVRIWSNADKVFANYYMAMYDSDGSLKGVDIIPFDAKSLFERTTKSIDTDTDDFTSVRLFAFDENQMPLNSSTYIK